MKQKDTFLRSEGDAWFARNQQAIEVRKLPEDDPLLQEIIELLQINDVGAGLKILEIGCADGTRLAWLKNNFNADCYGIEPSGQAVAAACSKGINVHQGSADLLPFDNHSFDIVLFGFCLYLCDREDLFRIAYEADRVLRSPGWLIIHDFFSSVPKAKKYHHRPGVESYKMDYRTLFNWHPDYVCMTHKIRHHNKTCYTDEQDEWVAASIMRKHHRELNT
jgi:ubiquinone/menaquinone biosynthesis C-methylase UbiE